jgi:hypothetical protein
MTTGQCESHLNHSLATIVNAEFVRISLIRLSSARFWRRAEGKQDRQVCYERKEDMATFPKKALKETMAFHYSDIKNLENISQET